MEKEITSQKIKVEISKSKKVKINPDELENYEDTYCGVNSDNNTINQNANVNKKVECYKCKKTIPNFILRTQYICKNCFLTNLVQRFRSNLRSQCKARSEDTILIVVDGSHSSIAMAQLFSEGLNHELSNRRLVLNVKFLYIEDSIIYKCPSRSALKEDNLQYIKQVCTRLKLEWDYLSLETCLNIKDYDKFEKIDYRNCSSDCSTLFQTILSKIENKGSFVEDFVEIIKRKLVFHYSFVHKFDKIIFPNSAQTFATSMFNNIIKGRGSSLRSQVGFIDTHFYKGKVTLLYPMKDMHLNEILIYNYLNDLKQTPSQTEYYSILSMPCKMKENTNTILKTFFNTLQLKMSSTINTAISTAEKNKGFWKFGEYVQFLPFLS